MTMTSTEFDATGANATRMGEPREPWYRVLTAQIEHERPRWFIWLPIWFGAGIAAYFSGSAEPSSFVVAAVVGVALALYWAMPRGTVAAALGGAVLAAALGFAIAKARTEWVGAPVIERRLAVATVHGHLERIEPKPGRGGRVTIRVSRIDGLEPDVTPKRVRVRVGGPLSEFHPGDAVQLKATLSSPAAPALPGAYDFGRAAWFMGLGAVGYATGTLLADEALPPPPLSLRMAWAMERVRAAIGARITGALAGETGAIASALITGERGGISEATNDAFRDSGLFHALSISGLHMAVMAGAIFWSLRLLLACSSTLALRYPIKKWAAAGAALGALFYLLISGASPPTQRSYVMISIMFVAIMLDRQALALRNIALSALLILALFPDSLLDLGFQMSYAAVGALVAAHEVIQRWRARRTPPVEMTGVWRWARNGIGFFAGIAISTIIASLAVAPFGAFYFHKSQQYAILGNVLGLPICDLYIMPLALATLLAMPFGLEAFPLWMMGLGIDALVDWAKFVASLPGAVASVQAIPQASFALMVVGGIWLALWGSRLRMLGLVAIAMGLAIAPFARKPDLIVGSEGKVIAVRQPDGRLAALAQRGRNFELARWLEYDGDSRNPAEVAAGQGFRCDAVGCTASVKGAAIAISRSPASLADDCRKADILVVLGPRQRSCPRPVRIIDLYALRDLGTHAVVIEDGIVRTETVAGTRGARPWSQSGLGKLPPGIQVSEDEQGRVRLPSFAPRHAFGPSRFPPENSGGDFELPLSDALPEIGD